VGGVLPGAVVPGTAAPAPSTSGETLPTPKEEDKDKDKESMAPSQARLIVQVPADTQLFIDDQPVKVPSGQRAFHTPALEKGQTYYYELRAETRRAGRPVVQTRRVLVRAGEEIQANFTDPQNPVVQTARAR